MGLNRSFGIYAAAAAAALLASMTDIEAPNYRHRIEHKRAKSSFKQNRRRQLKANAKGAK